MKNNKGIILILFSIAGIAALLFVILLSNKGAADSNSEENTSILQNTNAKKIESLEEIDIGGIKQSIYLTGNDTSKPILLFLHGGPGYAMMPLLHKNNRELERNFLVVNWDQRGAGLSYSKDIPKTSMTLSQFVSDVHELTSYLKTRFGKQKIFLAGHSFGTILGLKAVEKYPQDYFAYVSIGQVVSFAENEQLSYDFALKSAKQANNTTAINELTKAGRPDSKGNYKSDSGYDVTIKWVEYYGGDIYGKTSTDKLDNELYNSKIYKDSYDKIEAGWSFSNLIYYDEEVNKLDFRKQIKTIKVPIYFFSGKHDYDTPFVLAEEYYKMLTAPKKEFVWFENSAHFPFYEEPQKFNNIMINKVLPETMDSSGLSGKWTGKYTINQTETEVTLEISKNEAGEQSAVFIFKPSATIIGSFNMKISADSSLKSLVFTAKDWIMRPGVYEMVSMKGAVSQDKMSGSIISVNDGSSIGIFTVTKKTE